MTKRSKKKGRKRPSAQSPKYLASIQKKLEQGPFRDYKLVNRPPGQEKMSAVLEEFVAPYIESAETEVTMQKLFTLAIAAWNAALLPEEERRKMVKELVEATLKGGPRSAKRDMRSVLDELIQRKLTHFAENRRYIIDFELKDTGRDYHLSVVSTMEGPKGSENG